MSAAKVQPIRPAKPRIVKLECREFSEIMDDLYTVRCTLACAVQALGHSQDYETDNTLDVKAWKVISECHGRLDNLSYELDSWHAAHEHSLKEANHG